jgi:anti-sigma factor RsiW
MTDPTQDGPPCAAVVELISDYLDDVLPPDDRARLDAHLAECEGCATVLDQFATTIRLTGRLAVQDVDRLDDTTRHDLLRAFRSWVAEQPGDQAR